LERIRPAHFDHGHAIAVNETAGKFRPLSVVSGDDRGRTGFAGANKEHVQALDLQKGDRVFVKDSLEGALDAKLECSGVDRILETRGGEENPGNAESKDKNHSFQKPRQAWRGL
jgi:hypothetical protein